MKYILTILFSILFINNVTYAETVLKISAIPDESPTELQRKFTPLGKYLEKELGVKIEFVPVSDYPSVVNALVSDKIDMAWLGGFTFVQAKRKGSVLPILQREEDRHFTSTFIANVESGIKNLNDLKGKDFAFGSPSSTSGHIMPRYYLVENKIDADKDFKNIAFSGAHDATVAWVQSGKVPAGVLNTSVWEKLVEQKKVDLTKVKVIFKTPEYFDYNWTVRANLDPKLVKRIELAFLKLDLKNISDKEIMDLQRTKRFIKTEAKNYSGIEKAAQSAGLF